MIPIHKGPAPAVLTDKGTLFQNEAIACWTDPSRFPRPVPAPPGAQKKGRKKSDQGDPLKEALGKAADVDANGRCNGFASSLFSEYSYYSDATVKRQLIQTHHGKCAFCESFIMSTDYGDVEHYRPKAEVTQANPENMLLEQKVPEHPGYFWLSQTWENLFLSCKSCNQAYKGNYFDVVPALGHGGGGVFPRLLPDGQHIFEVPMLLDPSMDGGLSPRDVLWFDPSTAKAVPRAGGPSNQETNLARAKRTIDIVGLNRPRLLQARAACLLKLRALFITAAGGGGWVLSAEQQNIFKFQYQKDGPWLHAQKALVDAVEPWSEFSALAQDAIARWNAELVLAPVSVDVPLQQQVTIFVNQAIELSLEPWLHLVTQTRVAAEQQIAWEAAPDTRDLDLRYNEALQRYKTTVEGTVLHHLQIEQARKEIAALEQQAGDVESDINRKLFDETGLQDPLTAIQVEEENLQKNQNTVRMNQEIVVAADRYANTGDESHLSGIPPLHRDIVREWAAATPQTRRQQYDELQGEAFQNEVRAAKLNQQRLQLLNFIEGDRLQLQYLHHQIDLVEDTRLYPWLGPAAEIREEMVGLAEAYRRRGAPKERADRCEDLGAGAGALEDLLLEGAPATPQLQQHMQKKGWPAAIRLK